MFQLHFFASLRERLGCSVMNMEYTGQQDVEEIKQYLIGQGAPWNMLEEQEVVAAVNQTICDAKTAVHDGDEIAFFPPVTGG